MRRAERGWYPALILAVPFLAGIAALKGLTVEIDTYHGSDVSAFHLPTIRQFYDQLPGVDLGEYPAAQTPLFHLLMALWGKLVGLELWRLRLLNVGISYVALVVLYRWLIEGFGFERRQALALAVLFGLSPFVLGASFTLLTDNLALLFGLVALRHFHRAARDGSLGQFAIGCAAMGGAALTRQSFLLLAPVAAWALLSARPGMTRLAAGAGMAAVSVAPIAALLALWGDLVPEGSDPSSCGVCKPPPGLDEDRFTVRTLGFTVGLFGLYAAAVYGPVLAGRLRELRVRPAVLLPPLAAGLALVAVSDLTRRPAVDYVADDGYLWRLSQELPQLGSSSLLFWALVPLGAVAIWLLVRRAGLLSLPVVYIAALLVSTIPVRLVYQKYFDPFALLALILLMRPSDLRSMSDYAGIGALAVGFVAFALRPYV